MVDNGEEFLSNHPCANCIKQKAPKRCGGGCGTWYCGKSCQIQHWREGGHKDRCKKLKSERRTLRGLPAEESLPHLFDQMLGTISRTNEAASALDVGGMMEAFEKMGSLSSQVESQSGTPLNAFEACSTEEIMNPQGRSLPNQPVGPPVIGDVVTVISLNSEVGKALNGKRALVLTMPLSEDESFPSRYGVKIEGVEGTKALKVGNLQRHRPRLALDNREGREHPDYMSLVAWYNSPNHRLVRGTYNFGDPDPYVLGGLCQHRDARGIAFCDDPPPRRARKLVEMVARPCPPKFEALERSVLAGEVFKWYMNIGEQNLRTNCNMYELEIIPSLMALGAMCVGESAHAIGCGTGAKEAVLLAFLEAGEHPISTLIDTIACTPFIGVHSEFVKDKRSFERSQKVYREKGVLLLTPDQEGGAYSHFMKSGPLCLLHEMAQFWGATPLFAKIQQHKKYKYLVRRLLRLIAREAMKKSDGVALGPMSRIILKELCDLGQDKNNFLNEKITSREVAKTLGNKKSIVTPEDLKLALVTTLSGS